MLLAIIFSIIISNDNVFHLGQRSTTDFQGVNNNQNIWSSIYSGINTNQSNERFKPSYGQEATAVSTQRTAQLQSLLNECIESYVIESIDYCKEFASYYGYTLAEIDNASKIFTAQINHNLKLNSVSYQMEYDTALATQEMHKTNLEASKKVNEFNTNIWTINSKSNLVSDYIVVPTQNFGPRGFNQRLNGSVQEASKSR